MTPLEACQRSKFSLATNSSSGQLVYAYKYDNDPDGAYNYDYIKTPGKTPFFSVLNIANLAGEDWEPVSPHNSLEISADEFKTLAENTKWLQALESAGVDNWEGIDVAREMM